MESEELSKEISALEITKAEMETKLAVLLQQARQDLIAASKAWIQHAVERVVEQHPAEVGDSHAARMPELPYRGAPAQKEGRKGSADLGCPCPPALASDKRPPRQEKAIQDFVSWLDH